MAGMDTVATRNEIEAIVGRIAEIFRPQRIILFGSHAYGQPTRHSDVDLLVNMESDCAPIVTGAKISSAIDHPFPLDIMVVRPSDWDEYLRERAVFATQVAESGLVLYEAGDPRVH